MNNEIIIRNLDPQEITINEGGTITGITNVYVNGTDVTIGTKAYVIVPTKLSELTNDEGFITNAEETDPTVPSYVKEITMADINNWNDKQDELVSGSNIKTINNNSLLGSGDIEITATEYVAGTGIDITGDTISNTITSYQDLTDLPTPITNTSQLVNDSGFINKYVNDLENYLNIDLLSNILPKSSDSGDGELYLEDSAETKLNITLNPHEMVQHTTQGYNLFDITNLVEATKNDVTLTKNEDGSITLNGTASADANFDFYITSIDSDSNYKLQLYNQDGSYTGNYVSVYMATDNTWSDFNMLAISNNALISMSLGNKTYTYARVKVNTGVVCNNLKMGVQVVDDSTITTFEEYTGGMQSPNPLYPQDVHWTSRDNTIKLQNKNLFNVTLELGTYDSSTGAKQYSTVNYRTADKIKILPDTTYTLSIDGVSQKYVLYYYDNEENFISADSSLLTGTFTSLNNAYYINIRCFNADFTNDYETLKLQLERGSTATSYVEHEEIEYPVNLEYPENYCKIDDYADRYFKNVPEDPDYSIVLSEGAWYQKLNVFALYLSYNNNFDSVTEYSNFYLFTNHNPADIPGRPPVSDSYGRSTVFGVDQGGIITNNKIQVGSGYINIYLDKKVGISTLEDLTDWINNTDIIAWFKSAVPEVEHANNELSEQFETLKNDVVAYDGGTTITQVNDDLPFDLEASTFKKVS